MNAPQPRCAVAIIISGRGSNMRALIEDSRGAGSNYEICAVFSDKAEAPGLETARSLGIATQAVPADGFMDRAAYDRHLAAVVARSHPRLVVLAGFMRILTPAFVRQFEGRMFNIHPSLLPRYAGLHTHRRALAAGDAEHGATVHFVTEELDTGPPVLQVRVPIHDGDDEAKLAARVQVEEHRIYPQAVRWFCAGRLQWRNGQAFFDEKALTGPVQWSSA